MNSPIFRRDNGPVSVSLADLRLLHRSDASRADPEPPALPLGKPAISPAMSECAGGEGDSFADVRYAQRLIKIWGAQRALSIALAEGKNGAIALLTDAVMQAQVAARAANSGANLFYDVYQRRPLR